jgi:hypothetical protein
MILPYTAARHRVLLTVQSGEVHVVGGHPFRLGVLMISAERAVFSGYRTAGLVDVDRLTGRTSLAAPALILLGHYDARVAELSKGAELELLERTAW